MRSRKRLLLIACMVGILVLTMAVVSILLRPPAYPSITLEDGRIFSFAGVTVGTEPFLFLERTSVSRVFWKPVASLFPNSQTFFRKLGVNPPWFLFHGAMGVKNDDVSFWILTESKDGRNSTSSSTSSDGRIVNGIHIKILDSETEQNFRANGGGGHNPDDNRSFGFVFVSGLRKVTRKVDIILSRENDDGILEELTIWKVEIP